MRQTGKESAIDANGQLRMEYILAHDAAKTKYFKTCLDIPSFITVAASIGECIGF